MTVYTIGHGNRAIEEFLGLLREAAIECLVDVRAYPASRRHPQFSREALERSLAGAGIRYVWEGKALGGRRKAAVESPHVALRSASFRAYADHMATEEFRAGARRLLELANGARIAIMCAERLPWECHRNLVSDRLVADGFTVLHLIGAGSRKQHRLSAVARLHGGALIYDGGTQSELRV
jgi:uncharacterized protein (DUF488 family)